MELIRRNSEQILSDRIADLRRRNVLWFAMQVRLSKLTIPASPAAIEALSNAAVAAAGEDNVEMYRLKTYDIVLIFQRVPGDKASRLASDICFLFGEDPLAHSEMTERGNTLCAIYRTKEEIIEFHKIVMALKCTGSGGPYQPDPEVFAKARLLRRIDKRLSILIVEEQRFMRQLVAEMLGVQRYNIVMAENGQEALKSYEAYAPDIVFLDIDLPDISGHTVLDQIIELDSSAFVVMLTAAGQPVEDVRRVLRKARGYIIKPFSKKKIGQYVTMFCQQFPERADIRG